MGGLGVDTLTGGAGADIFQFKSIAHSGVGVGRDIVTDFEQGSDLIDLSSIYATTFIGTAAFSRQAGEVRYASFDGATIIEADTNGDGRGDFQLELDDSLEMTIADFLGVETNAAASPALFASEAGVGDSSGDIHMMPTGSGAGLYMANEVLIA